MEINTESNIGAIVAANYKTAAVFKKYGIDFCCNGNRTIGNACSKKQSGPEQLIRELEEVVTEKSNDGIDFQSFPLDLLADYIEKTHHRYVAQKIGEITPFLHKIVQVHGMNHPELMEVERLFLESAGDLSAHLKKEELMLFPYIRGLVKAALSGSSRPKSVIGTAAGYIAEMEKEHDAEGERFRTISALTGQYTPPEDACGTYRVTFRMLEEFEEDLHRHIHLENNILFPKSVELEEQLPID